jgi:hypothetical protein
MIRHPRMRHLSLVMLCTVLFAPSPARAWQSAIGGTGKAPDGEFAQAVALDGNRDVIVAGYLVNKDPRDYATVFTAAKFSGATGAVLWRKEQTGRRDAAEAVVLTPTGDAVVAGRVDRKFVVIRHASGDGSELSRYTTANDGTAVDVVLDAVGNAVAAGNVELIGFDADMYVAKIAPNGTEIWKVQIAGGKAGEADVLQSVAVDGDGNVVACGTLRNADAKVLFVVKLNGNNGNEIWRKEVPGDTTTSFSSEGFKILVLDNDDVVAAGERRDPDFNQRALVVRLAKANGNEVWRYESVASGSAAARALILDGAGNLIAGGNRLDAASGYRLGFVVKLNPASGAPLWETLLHGDAPVDKSVGTIVFDLAAGPTDDIGVTGRVDGKKGTIFGLFELAAADGKEIFRQTFPKKLGLGRALVIDGQGALIAVGATAFHWLVTKVGAPTAGKAIVLKDEPVKTDKRALQVAAADKSFVFGSAGGPGDPVLHGATLVLKNPTTLETQTISLPAANWVSAGAQGFTYADKALAAGPCAAVAVKLGSWSAKCKGAQIAFTLDEPAQGSLGATLNLGSVPSCVLFGGQIKKDLAAGAKAGVFQGKGAPPPAACP